MRVPGCPLCEGPGGESVFEGSRFRVIRAAEPGYPAFYRLVWGDHAREFSDLAPHERARCMEALVAVEQVLRERLDPAKINVASLGNIVAHLHWHVVARFEWDPSWPQAVWAPAQRGVDAAAVGRIEGLRKDLEGRLRDVLEGLENRTGP